MINFDPSLYDILGRISREASQADIKKTYRILASTYHPDKNPNDSFNANEKMQELNEAYAILSDPKKRAEYNEQLRLYEIQKRVNNSSNQKNENYSQTSATENSRITDTYAWGTLIILVVIAIGLFALTFSTENKEQL